MPPPDPTLKYFLRKITPNDPLALRHWSTRQTFFSNLDRALSARWKAATLAPAPASTALPEELLAHSLDDLDRLADEYRAQIAVDFNEDGDDKADDKAHAALTHISHTSFGMRQTVALLNSLWDNFTSLSPPTDVDGKHEHEHDHEHGPDFLTLFSGEKLFDFFQWVQNHMYPHDEQDKNNHNHTSADCIEAWLRSSNIGRTWALAMGWDMAREGGGGPNFRHLITKSTSNGQKRERTMLENLIDVLAQINPLHEPVATLA